MAHMLVPARGALVIEDKTANIFANPQTFFGAVEICINDPVE